MFGSNSYFDEFDNMFNKVYNVFNRPVKDMKPFRTFQVDDKGFIIVCNTTGIDPDKITVKIEKEQGRPYPILKITGETKIERIDFENRVNLGIELRLDREIEKLSYEVKNGLTTVYIKLKGEQKDVLSAQFIDKDDSLDW